MSNAEIKYLLFLTKNYSFSILKPLFDEIISNKEGDVFWYSTKSERFDVSSKYWLNSSSEVMDYNPNVIFAPGNVVPANWPGLKVQLFHGLGEEKKGHYRLNGLYHLYCTPGPFITKKFRSNNSKKRFAIAETGWTKIDNIYNLKKPSNKLFNNSFPIILYAPTFSKKLTSAHILFDEIVKLQNRDFNWMIKFHELMDKETLDVYKEIASNKLMVIENDDILPLMEESNMLLTDTSSVAYEYLFFNKPLVTFNARSRQDKGINIFEPSDLEGAILRALADPDEFMENREFYLNELHPYTDGKSSARVILAVKNILKTGYEPDNKFSINYQFHKWKTRNLVN